MTVLIYFVCFAVASLIQTTLRYMLAAGDVTGIPGAFIFYLLAIFAARKWSGSYKERKAARKAKKDNNQGQM